MEEVPLFAACPDVLEVVDGATEAAEFDAGVLLGDAAAPVVGDAAFEVVAGLDASALLGDAATLELVGCDTSEVVLLVCAACPLFTDLEVDPPLAGVELMGWSVDDVDVVAAAPSVVEDVCVVELLLVWVGAAALVETSVLLKVAV